MEATDDPTRALEELLGSLRSLGADALADDIRPAVARGTLREVESERREREEARRPYDPRDAYILAVRMVLAAVEPAIMLDDMCRNLSDATPEQLEIVWRPDFLEGTTPEASAHGALELPALPLDVLKQLRTAAEAVVVAVESLEARG